MSASLFANHVGFASLKDAENAYSKIVKPKQWIDYLQLLGGNQSAIRYWEKLQSYSTNGVFPFGLPVVRVPFDVNTPNIQNSVFVDPLPRIRAESCDAVHSIDVTGSNDDSVSSLINQHHANICREVANFQSACYIFRGIDQKGNYIIRNDKGKIDSSAERILQSDMQNKNNLWQTYRSKTWFYEYDNHQGEICDLDSLKKKCNSLLSQADGDNTATNNDVIVCSKAKSAWDIEKAFRQKSRECQILHQVYKQLSQNLSISSSEIQQMMDPAQNLIDENSLWDASQFRLRCVNGFHGDDGEEDKKQMYNKDGYKMDHLRTKLKQFGEKETMLRFCVQQAMQQSSAGQIDNREKKDHARPIDMIKDCLKEIAVEGSSAKMDKVRAQFLENNVKLTAQDIINQNGSSADKYTTGNGPCAQLQKEYDEIIKTSEPPKDPKPSDTDIRLKQLELENCKMKAQMQDTDNLASDSSSDSYFLSRKHFQRSNTLKVLAELDQSLSDLLQSLRAYASSTQPGQWKRLKDAVLHGGGGYSSSGGPRGSNSNINWPKLYRGIQNLESSNIPLDMIESSLIRVGESSMKLPERLE